MCQPVVANIKDAIPMVGKFGMTSAMNAFLAKSISKHRDALFACIRTAGSNADATDLTDLQA